MSEAEVLEIMALMSSNAMTSFTIYISFTFAFLTACYFVGTDLTRIQVGVLCFLYLLSAGAGAASMLTQIDALVAIQEEYSTLLSGRGWWNLEAWYLFTSMMLTFGILGSLYFLFDIRRKE